MSGIQFVLLTNRCEHAPAPRSAALRSDGLRSGSTLMMRPTLCQMTPDHSAVPTKNDVMGYLVTSPADSAAAVGAAAAASAAAAGAAAGAAPPRRHPPPPMVLSNTPEYGDSVNRKQQFAAFACWYRFLLQQLPAVGGWWPSHTQYKYLRSTARQVMIVAQLAHNQLYKPCAIITFAWYCRVVVILYCQCG